VGEISTVLWLWLGSDQHRCLHSRQQTPIRNHVEEPTPTPTPHGTTKPKKMKNPPHLKNEAPRDHSTSCHHLPRYDLHIERMRENESESRNPREAQGHKREGKTHCSRAAASAREGGKQRGRSKSRDGR